MQIKPWIALMLTLAMLHGCATQQDYLFGKVGASDEDFNKDKTACEDETFTAKNVLGGTYVQSRNDCMIKKGWTLTNPNANSKP